MSEELDNNLPPESNTKITPFVIEVFEPTDPSQSDLPPNASVKITPALRTSGLLHDLSAEEVRNLLLILTFVTANGWCNPSIQQLAEAMGVGDIRAKARLARLVTREWHGKPLVHLIPRETGIDAYVPSDAVLSAVRIQQYVPETANALVATAGREAVIAHSREMYARPRAEVEREMAEMNGWELPKELMSAEELEVSEVRARLRAIGITVEQCNSLLATYDLPHITRQLDWLPHRNAKNPAGFVVAAIENEYDMPLALRLLGTPETAAPKGEYAHRQSSAANLETSPDK
jgi:hypothetical protein